MRQQPEQSRDRVDLVTFIVTSRPLARVLFPVSNRGFSLGDGDRSTGVHGLQTAYGGCGVRPAVAGFLFLVLLDQSRASDAQQGGRAREHTHNVSTAFDLLVYATQWRR